MTNTFKNIAMIVAADLNNGIGINNDIPWHISDDLKRFKQITSGHTIVMGRKTWESLPKKPLPKRRNIVLTHNDKYKADGAEVFHSVDDVANAIKDNEDVFVIGGSAIYREFYPVAAKLFLTRVYSSFETDTSLPFLDIDEWVEVENGGKLADEKSGVEYAFIDYIRKSY